MRAIFINGSPRKNKNTAQMLESALKGAQEAGAEVELIHLQNLQFKGCGSCFACKRTGNKCNGLCAQRDDLQPILARILQADVLVVGSPIYWSYPTGMFRNFIERLLFPILRYDQGEKPGTATKYTNKRIQTALIYTMGATPEYFEKMHYDTILAPDRMNMEQMFGSCEVVMSRNTWQFTDYSKFDSTVFDMASKQYARDHQWPQDLQAAYDLGKRLVEKAKEIV